jgi:NAD(P)-dependent dehydrogenase (short-subunit alcohol dehydrogenase family)
MLPQARTEHRLQPSVSALCGRVVLVTGANGGLGRACALSCARAGASLVLAGRKVSALEGVYDEIERAGGASPAIYPINLEGAAPQDYAAMVEAIRIQCGRLDALVHAAAHFDGLRPLAQTQPIDWLKHQQVGLNAPFLLTQACMPLLREREDAAVVFVLEDPDRVSKAYWGGYGVAKAGLAALASVFHEESESGPVRVHGLLPAPMRTALRRMAYFGENTVERELPERAGEAAAFLATAQAAAWRGKILDLRPLD